MRVATKQVQIPRAILGVSLLSLGLAAYAQETDVTQTPNVLSAGIQKSYVEQIGAGRGDVLTPDSSAYIIARDPARAIVRGRQLFQRKFTLAQGLGPRTNDGVGDIGADPSHGAGLADSCAACHGRPQGSAGFGGVVFTRPTSRDAPHLFGLGLVEMLGDEITQELRELHAQALAVATSIGIPQTVSLQSKGIDYGVITAFPDGTSDTSGVIGVDPDLRVRPFFAQGGTISIREFLVGAFNAEMGLESGDSDLNTAAAGGRITTPSGMVLDGSLDSIEGAPARDELDDVDGDGVVDEVPQSVVDFMEFYLLNYFSAGVRTDPVPAGTAAPAPEGLRLFRSIGCADCHIPDFVLDDDRRVADTVTRYDPSAGNPFNSLYSTATVLFDETDDGSGHPTLKLAKRESFHVKGIFADFKRHDLGPNFYEQQFDGTIVREFMTEPLWGVASTAPYGHDGRSPSLTDVILRHGGEALASRDAFEALSGESRSKILGFLDTLVLFSPPSTASDLNPADTSDPNYPMEGHGSIDLGALFNDPSDKE